jgi:hypothetical protein
VSIFERHVSTKFIAVLTALAVAILAGMNSLVITELSLSYWNRWIIDKCFLKFLLDLAVMRIGVTNKGD